jgi:hypothetical protein
MYPKSANLTLTQETQRAFVKSKYASAAFPHFFFDDFNGVATLCEPHIHDQSYVLVCAFFLAPFLIYLELAYMYVSFAE